MIHFLLVLALVAENALHQAVEKGGHEAVERVLRAKKPDLNARTQSGETPLFYAAFRKDPWFADRLLAAGADPKAVNSAGETPLFWAAPGAENRDGITPRDYAEYNRHQNVVKLLEKSVAGARRR